MESTLSHDPFAFTSPNAMHGGLHSVPNHDLAHFGHRQQKHLPYAQDLDITPTKLHPGFQQSSPFAPRMAHDYSQPYASTSSSSMYGGFDVHPQQFSNAQIFQPNGFGHHRTGSTTISPIKLTPLSINPHNRSLQPSPTTSSPSSSSSRAQVFSRRSDGVTGSPPRSAQGDVLFCRTASPHGRQRTAQACEKCRDRKTKCSGDRPICKRCKDRGLTCEWAPETRIRGPQRKQKQSRLSSEETDSPKSKFTASPASQSYPNSPLNPSETHESATVELKRIPPLLNTSGRLIGIAVDPRSKNDKWPAGLSHTVQRGEDAKMIMGQPILPITPSSDCWGSVADAEDVDHAEYIASLRRLPKGVNLLDTQNMHLRRTTNGESSGSSDNSSPPSADTHMFTAPTSNTINPQFSYAHHAPIQMPMMDGGMNGLHANMLGIYDFQYPPTSQIDPSLLGLFGGEHTEFAHAAMMNGGSIPADDITPMPNSDKAKEDDFMNQIFDTEAFMS